MKGKWVKQYRAGYWLVVGMKPKYAESGFAGENISWKKGDRLGDWALLVKGFTPKMKFKLDSDYCDAKLLRPISDEEQAAIEGFFSHNPKLKDAFDQYMFEPAPAIVNLWVDLPPENERAFKKELEMLTSRFTKDAVDSLLSKYCLSSELPSQANCLCNLLCFPWELTDEYDQLFIKAELVKLK